MTNRERIDFCVTKLSLISDILSLVNLDTRDTEGLKTIEKVAFNSAKEKIQHATNILTGLRWNLPEE